MELFPTTDLELENNNSLYTHPLNILSGITTSFSSKIHQNYIQKFDECWIPDIDSLQNLTGKLSNPNKINKHRFIGVLSRFKKQEFPKKYDVLILLSGIESARNRLEKKLFLELKNDQGTVLFVKGKLTETKEIKTDKNRTYCIFLLTNELEKAINESEIVICRSEYSTIMDLAVLDKKVFFYTNNRTKRTRIFS